MEKVKLKIMSREARKQRIRKKIFGTAQRPRMCVKRSLKHIYVQLVDDMQARSLLQLSSRSKELLEKKPKTGGKISLSRLLGNAVAEKAIALGVKKVIFDRGGYLYHGRIKAVADGAREKGLDF